MTGNRNKFISFTPINEDTVTFGGNAKNKVTSKGIVGKLPNSYIDDVLYMKGLNHNLLSMSNFFYKGNQLIFNA